MNTADEELARRRVARLGDEARLPFLPEYIGRAWAREVELDVVAVSWKERSVLLGECKWRRTPSSGVMLDDLIARSGKFRRFEGFKKHFALFSRAGFTAPLVARAAGEHVLLFAGADLTPVE